MIRRTGRAIAALALTISSFAGSASAQPGSLPAGGPQGAPPAQPQREFRTSATMRGPADFQVTSNPRGLLRRPEVQREIGLDLKQKNAIAAVEEEAVKAVRDQMDAALQGQDPRFRQMNAVQRRMWVERQQRLYEARMHSVEQAQGELDAKVRAILRPEQLQRLHELDLQKRGPLSLGDPRVAEELKLSPQTRAAEMRVLAEYQSALRQVVTDAVQEAVKSGEARPGVVPDFESRLSPVRKKLQTVRDDAEKKALESLTEEERAAWTAAQGKKFTFRADPPPARPRGGRL